MFDKVKAFSPYIAAAAAGGVFALYALGAENPSKGPSEFVETVPLQSTSHLTPEASSLETRHKADVLNPQSLKQPFAHRCENTCGEIQTLLYADARIEDEAYESLSAQIAELAAYLEGNEAARMEMLHLVMTTEDGNKRALVIDAFTRLSAPQRLVIGAALLKSENWQIRTDGIKLSTEPHSLTSDKAMALMKTFSKESHPHVKTTILDILKNTESLKGEQDTLDNLSIILSSEADTTVKSAALLTKLALHEDPVSAMPDVLTALSSQEPEFQTSALVALERIYETDKATNGTLNQIDQRVIEDKLENLLLIQITPENEAVMGHLLKEADAFYERHF